METLIVCGVLAVALVFTVRAFYRMLAGKAGAGCGTKCSQCSSCDDEDNHAPSVPPSDAEFE